MALEPEVQSGEDFVHVDDPITNVEKEELLGEEEEYEHSTAGSVITGGDPTENSGEDDDNIGDRAVEKLEELPLEFRKNVMVLAGESAYVDGCCDVYLVGTCHVSQESCRVVEGVISSLKPKAVFVELCMDRFNNMYYWEIVRKGQPVEYKSMIDMWKKNYTILEILFIWVAGKFAKYLDVDSGAEFRVAYEAAEKCGAIYLPGDRPMEITFQRTSHKMSLWQKIKLVYSDVFEVLFSPTPEREEFLELVNDVDKLTLMVREMWEDRPSVLVDTYIHERDKYMTYFLWETARKYSSVVAVVGITHLQGIKKNWGQEPTTTLKELEELPPVESTSTAKKIMYLGLVVAGIAIVSSMYLSSF